MRLPAGGGAEDSRGLFWILDEEVRVEGSQDSVVLERLCAASEKKGAGAEGEGGNRGGGGLLSSSSSLPVGVGLCLLKALTRPALGGLCTCLGVCLHSFVCSSIHDFIMCSEWALIYTEANSLIRPLSLLGRGRGGR